MVKAVLEEGTIRPLDPFPPEWQEGQRLVIEMDSAVRPEEVSAWVQEMDEAAQEIPAEDHTKFLVSLSEQKEASKEWVRRQMGLP